MEPSYFQLGSEYTRDILAWLRSRELSTPGCRQQVLLELSHEEPNLFWFSLPSLQVDATWLIGVQRWGKFILKLESGGHHFARHEGINQVQVAGKLGLSSATLHLALRIVDLFMDGHDIQVGTTQNWCEFTPHVLPALRSHSYTWCVLGRCCWQVRWRRGNNLFISRVATGH